MNLDYEAIENLKLAISRISKAKKLLQNELTKVEACNDNRLSRSAIEESYVATIDTLNRISFALEDIEPEKNINYGFRFRFSRLPNLKSSRSLSRVSDRFAIEVAEKIVATIPKNFQKMSGANVIFVSHVLNDGPHKSRYFDNDNLAIKSILDIIVPYICIDDATRYCDNFYLSQHDMNEFSELYIVKKSCIKAWAAAHRELDFARAII